MGSLAQCRQRTSQIILDCRFESSLSLSGRLGMFASLFSTVLIVRVNTDTNIFRLKARIFPFPLGLHMLASAESCASLRTQYKTK